MEFNSNERLICEQGDSEEYDQEDDDMQEDNKLQQECFDFYHKQDLLNDQSLIEIEDLDSNGYP